MPRQRESSNILPPRDLGLAEPWGREIENHIRSSESGLNLLNQTIGNLDRQSSAFATQTERQLKQLSDLLDRTRSNQRRLAETVSSGSWSESISGNSWGERIEVERPLWASTAIVIAGMDNFSNQSSPWGGRIEVVASASSPTTGDVGKSRDPVVAQVNGTNVVVGSNPRVVIFSGDGGDVPSSTPLYLRARGVRVTGTTSRTYSYDVAYAVIWS